MRAPISCARAALRQALTADQFAAASCPIGRLLRREFGAWESGRYDVRPGLR
jgi:hypothetical protein